MDSDSLDLLESAGTIFTAREPSVVSRRTECSCKLQECRSCGHFLCIELSMITHKESMDLQKKVEAKKVDFIT